MGRFGFRLECLIQLEFDLHELERAIYVAADTCDRNAIPEATLLKSIKNNWQMIRVMVHARCSDLAPAYICWDFRELKDHEKLESSIDHILPSPADDAPQPADQHSPPAGGDDRGKQSDPAGEDKCKLIFGDHTQPLKRRRNAWLTQLRLQGKSWKELHRQLQSNTDGLPKIERSAIRKAVDKFALDEHIELPSCGDAPGARCKPMHFSGARPCTLTI